MLVTLPPPRTSVPATLLIWPPGLTASWPALVKSVGSSVPLTTMFPLGALLPPSQVRVWPAGAVRVPPLVKF